MSIVEPQTFFKTLCDANAPIINRYIAVFELKNIKTEKAIKYMLDSYPFLGDSELMKHELVYTLGQVNESFYPVIKEFLYECVKNKDQQKLVRHQAAEAIANYFDDEAIPLLQSHLNCGVEYLQQTCQLALRKIKNKETDRALYGLQYAETRQPAAPFTKQEFKNMLKEHNLEQLYKQKSYIGVLQQPLDLVTKYRILYYLRNLNTNKVRLELCKILSKNHFKNFGALFKHQVCFVLGQIGLNNGEQEALVRQCIQNQQEQDIARHQALAAVASQSKDEAYLQKFAQHPNQIIRQSALVAIGQIKYWHS